MLGIEVNVREAKARLSELLDRVAAGEQVTIGRCNDIVAKLVPPAPQRRPDGLKGRIWMALDFNETPEDIIELMKGGRDP